jgi:mRNA interferase RelE/StbE
MNVVFRHSFLKDLRKINDQGVLRRIRQTIEIIEAAQSLQTLPNLKKMSGADDFYRIRIGDYRIGIALEGTSIEFVRCLHRREIYRYFP